MRALEATESAFEAANSTLFMLLGGLSFFAKMRRGLGTRSPAIPQASHQPAGMKGDHEGQDAGSDPFTLAILGLIAAGQRLDDRCAEVAKTSAHPSPSPSPSPAPATVTPRRGRAAGARRTASLRALSR